MSRRDSFAWRVRAIAALVLLIASVFLGRLYFLQVVHGAEYRQEAEREYVRQSGNQVDRGSIFFTTRDGSLLSAATIVSGYTIAINPERLSDPEAAYTALAAHLLSLEKVSFLEKAKEAGSAYEEIARRSSPAIGAAVSAADIPGVDVLKETWRFYPGGSLGGQVIGFIGYGADGKTLSGRYGLERFYDEALSRSFAGLSVNFFADLFTNIRADLFSDDAGPGGDLVTSLEPTVQSFLRDQLKKYREAWHPRIVGGIVMDPRTGAVIAMDSLPSFDPNDFKNADPEAFSNPLVEDVYEFGSIMKPITMSSGIDAGVVTPKTTYHDAGFIVLDGARVSNFDGKGRGTVPMQEVLNQSLNTGAAFVTERMGADVFRSYLMKFGITEEAGIDLPNEGSPLTENLSSPRLLEYVTASFGQGIAVTPVAMTRALATLANHGVVPSPHVGVTLTYGGGREKDLNWSPPRQAIRPESAETITRMLVEVVDTALRGGTVKIPAYSIAAKTGTAQIARPDARGYYADRYLHSFFGYFPAYDARFLIFLFAVELTGAQYASETLTTPFMDTVRFLINYYAVPPDRAQRGT